MMTDIMDKRRDTSNDQQIYKDWISDGKHNITDTVLVLPPPNVTGNLHIGHMYNATIIDIMARYLKIGIIPGTDHAGIATQSVVLRQLKKEHKRSHFTRDEILDKAYKWTADRKETIRKQFSAVGVCCDFTNEQFTMSATFNDHVNDTFIKLYDDGLLYRAARMINWCPCCRTALSDDEVEKRENKGKMYHIRYGDIVIATTRPETMLGDVAVATYPDNLISDDTKITLPIINKKLPLIRDDRVHKDVGTGYLKVTPSHSNIDYEICKDHDITEFYDIIDERGRIYNTDTIYDGMDRFKARKEIINDLGDLVVKIDDHTNTLSTCYRCNTVIENRVSNQWFIKMDRFVDDMNKVLDNDEIKFYPEHHKKIARTWLSSVHDWCISRQIVWGHRIPAYYKDGDIVVSKEIPDGYTQDNDVLDTWFSSCMYPYAISCGSIHTLITGGDILYFWVLRMIMMTRYITGKNPFDRVLLHGLIRTSGGQKMSKSLNNAIDPLDVIGKYGADAARFAVVMSMPHGQDGRLGDKDFDLGKRFVTKIWNLAKYVLTKTARHHVSITNNDINIDALAATDRDMLREIDDMIKVADDHITCMNFQALARGIYNFIWNRFCSVYIEYDKSADDTPDRSVLLLAMLDKIIKIIEPIMPFISHDLKLMIK